MKCINCYKEIKNTMKFCNYCGTKQPADRAAYEREHPELADALPEDLIMKQIKEKEQVAARQAENAAKRTRVATVKATGRRVSPRASSLGNSSVMSNGAQSPTGATSTPQPRAKRATAQPKPNVQPKSRPAVGGQFPQAPNRPLQSPVGNDQTVVTSPTPPMGNSTAGIPAPPTPGMSYPAMSAPAMNAPEAPTPPEVNYANEASPSQERIAVGGSVQGQSTETATTTPNKLESILKIAIIALVVAIVVFIILIFS